MKPIEPIQSKTVYILCRFDNTAMLTYCTVNSTGSNCYWSLNEAQQQQTLEALKGHRYHLFELELPV